ncbi:GTPase required for pre-60S ribosomal subunit nuclear export and maturation [Mitosporidium daphniae]|uniref:Nucleolar GTP-binding protein 2 n=1 Tax=Mitosporidium daphniae TaxID=1485682 RepID=A0A098VM38_9MICR|nr:uncharacterized protein DI09_94p40 [Mitosporidium daphniae]KGG50010.1 hypothetical protein DI09_94p40 [Mitosporidium daphniae]|eukprot:XP_013236446.1 uncharacterized protein DI09_94p40 [Mitosporidium daphniae]
MAKSSHKNTKAPLPSKKFASGENFYTDKTKLARKKLLKGGKPIRNKKGDIIRDAPFAKKIADSPVVRIEPNRKWFGNTRTMSVENIEKFRQEMENRTADPYQVLLRQNKLPMSLLQDVKRSTSSNLLQVESFSATFSKSGSRKRPKIIASSLEELVAKAEEEAKVSEEQNQTPRGADEEIDENDLAGGTDVLDEPIFKKGQSKRIWNELYKVIDSSDVLIHVLDARDPLGTLCASVETFLNAEAKHKHLIYLLNKCDLVPPAVTKNWISYLSKKRPTLAYKASLKNPYGKGSLISLLRQFSKLHPERKQISVGFIGFPNTGKSSVINSLKSKRVCTVAPIPGQTKVWQYVSLMKRIYLIDCPGIVPHSIHDSPTELVLKGAIRVENIATPEDHVDDILKRVRFEHLRKVYPSIVEGATCLEFISQVAKSRGKLLKGGEPDVSTAAKMILNDWIRGELPYFCNPPDYNERE